MTAKKLILAAGLCLAGALYAQPPALSLPHERFTLPNGLTVVLHQDRTLPQVAVNVWYHVGSGSEKVGRTGFAHLFEHILFEGSANVKEGDFDNLLEAAGGNNNGSTSEDRTNYYETVPSNAVDLALFLESDRMGFLLGAMSPAKVDGQRDVVKNERRQSYENRPYGKAQLELPALLYPEGHPYSWTVIGSMEDLSAASYDDVVEFFKKYYLPNNASLVIAGDIDLAQVRQRVEHWFSDVPTGQPAPTGYGARQRWPQGMEKHKVIEDRVQLPALLMAYPAPAQFTPGSAELQALAYILGQGKNSRLYQRLVYEMQIAQDVSVFLDEKRLGSDFYIYVFANPGVKLDQVKQVVDEEIARLVQQPPTARELQRVVNQYEAAFLSSLESIEFKADLMNRYLVETGNPDWLNEDLARYRALSPTDVQAAVLAHLHRAGRVVMSVVPQGQAELAVTAPAR